MGEKIFSGVFKEETDGHYFAAETPEGDLLTDWFGPYDTTKAAQAAFITEAETLITDMVKKALGIE